MQGEPQEKCLQHASTHWSNTVHMAKMGTSSLLSSHMEATTGISICSFQLPLKRYEGEREKRAVQSKAESRGCDYLIGSKKTGRQAVEPHRPGLGVSETQEKGLLQGCPHSVLGCGEGPHTVSRSEGGQPSLGGQEAAQATPGPGDGQRCGLRRLKKQRGFRETSAALLRKWSHSEKP